MELCLQNDKICVYSIKDWEKLRKEYRIVGEYLGSSQSTPTLPIKLLPEEALLLVEKNVAKLVQYPKLNEEPSGDTVEQYNKLRAQLQKAEQVVYQEYRKAELTPYVDKIVEAKRRKLNDDVSRTDVINEELHKVKVTEDNLIWPVLTEPLECVKGTSVPVPTSVLLQQTTSTKTAVFSDLWQQGYYVTCGKKFGGDFLVYAGDPIAFHAIYIVRCLEDSSKTLHTSELIAFGRLGTAVKKKSVLATCTNGTVNYITINWLDF